MNEPIAAALAALEDATGRLLGACAALTDAQVREPSALPGWTRGHVLTHIARNADGLTNLLAWARTGVATPMYASSQARDADIEAGAGRPAAELTADVRDSAERFAAAAAAMPEAGWVALVRRTLDSPPFPARDALDRRVNEVVIHHADLDAGYSPADWPPDWAAAGLPAVAEDFAGRDDVPACLLRTADGAYSTRIGPAGGQPGIMVEGTAAALLAWLIGRGGDALATTGADAPPALPRWR